MNRISARKKRAALLFIPAFLIVFSSTVGAQTIATNVHPVIGDKPPKELLASDILVLPEREQQAWIHGAVTMTAQTMSHFDQDRAGCVIGWYFESNGKGVIIKALNEYSDKYASSIVFAAAANACP